MCWAEKCCFCVPANVGCVLLGIYTFTLSLLTLAVSVAYLVIETDSGDQSVVKTVHFAKITDLVVNIPSLRFILIILIILSLLWLLFSVMLVIGVLKNKPSFVLSYFAYGIIVTIVCLLGGLLVLIQNCWILSLVLFILSCFNIHFMVVVHTVYDLMLRGKDFRFQRHYDDVDPLTDCFDDDASRI